MTTLNSTYWLLIANPAAGSGKCTTVAEHCLQTLRTPSRIVNLQFTKSPGHATELARRAETDGASRIVVCGGDGTVSEVLPVLADSKTALGLVPLGTCNDLARALGIPSRITAALDILNHGRVSSIDLGQCGNRLFSTVAAIGFDAEISHAMQSGTIFIPGTVGYLLAACKRIFSYHAPHARLEGKFGIWEGKILLVAVGNTSSYGGGLQIAPGADPKDGTFDVCIVRSVPRTTLLRMMPKLFTGEHVNHPAVRLERTTQLIIETDTPHRIYADGEYLGKSPATIELRAATLRTVLPPHTPCTLSGPTCKSP